MRVKVRLGGSLPQVAGRPVEQALDLPEGATVAEALAAAGVNHGLAMLVSVDGQLRPPSEALTEGNHVIVVPPVSGGSALPRWSIRGPREVHSYLLRLKHR